MFFKILRILTILCSLFCGVMIFANLGEPECMYFLAFCVSSIIATIILSRIIYLSETIEELNDQDMLNSQRISDLEKRIEKLENPDKKD